MSRDAGHLPPSTLLVHSLSVSFLASKTFRSLWVMEIWNSNSVAKQCGCRTKVLVAVITTQIITWEFQIRCMGSSSSAWGVERCCGQILQSMNGHGGIHVSSLPPGKSYSVAGLLGNDFQLSFLASPLTVLVESQQVWSQMAITWPRDTATNVNLSCLPSTQLAHFAHWTQWL